MKIYNFKLWNNHWFFKIILFISNFTLSGRLKIIIQNGELIETYHNAGDVVVLPKSKLVRRFSEYGSLIEEYKLVDKKITLEDDLENDQTEIVVTLLVKK